MDKWKDVKDKQRLVLYAIAGGYLFYQGIMLINSILKNGSPLSKNYQFYIFSAVFILFGLAIFYYVFKNIKKQLEEMKNTQQIICSDESEYKDGVVENAKKESLEGSENKLKEEAKREDD